MTCDSWVLVALGGAYLAGVVVIYAYRHRWGARLRFWIKDKLGMW
jgi:hypothetical protein